MIIEFNTSGAAFEYYGDMEVERILDEIVAKVKSGDNEGKILDINGNTIGKWEM